MTRSFAAAGLILMMAVGSVAMWIGAPLGWLVVASKLSNTSQPTLGPYLLVLFGLPVTMFLFARGLARLDGLHARVSGTGTTTRTRMPWLRSMRDTREQTRSGVLDRVMVISVLLAGVAGGVWFFFFAGSSLPT